MADIFISYSRRDKVFVHRLDEALMGRGREAWVDWEGIRPTEEFMQAIYRAIEAADTFVFVLTPDSVASEVCGSELAHAAAHNKRMVPLVARDVEAKAVPEALAKLNWIFCRESDDFEKATETLISALDTDLPWIRTHTRLLTRAIEWEAKGKNNSFGLRGDDLREAEQWLAQAGNDKKRQPTALQTEYIISSRKAAAKRQRIVLGAVSLGLIVSIVLTIVALTQRKLADERSQIALARQLAAQSELLRSQQAELLPRSVLLAVEAMRRFPCVEVCDTGTGKQTTKLPNARGRLAFSPDGKRITNGEQVWNTTTGKELSRITMNEDRAKAVAFSPDGKYVATGTPQQMALLWDAATGQLIMTLRQKRQRRYAALEDLFRHDFSMTVSFSRDGKYLATAGGDIQARVWDLESQREIALLPHQDMMSWAAFTRDGQRVLTTGDDRERSVFGRRSAVTS